MASRKHNDSQESSSNRREGAVIARSITSEMRESYLDYAMSVITSRALPDVRDGLKPVQRRILFVMHELGLAHTAKFRKCAKIAGDTSGNYHPHGESNVYGALVNLAQDFSMRYPLVAGQGNFGSVDGDPPAAMRYTEAKLSRVAGELLRDLEKETVDWRPNYEGTREEPIVLPAAVPNLLLNGTLGIAVGMATNIPPHNLREVIDATVHLIDHPKASTEDLLKYVTGPDFPTGGMIFNEKDIHHAYANGKGGVVMRGAADISEARGGSQIVITSLPYRVNKADLITTIADLVRDKKVEGIKDLRDESTREIRVVIDLKQTAHPQKVLNALYKHTQLEETFHFNMVGLVDDVPQTLSLKSLLEAFIRHRIEVITKRTQFDLRKAEDREHILSGLKKALDHIDKIIKLIRAAKDAPTAHKELMKEFRFSDRQATAILEMRLQKLAGLERKKVEEELEQVRALIKKLKAILASDREIEKVVKGELAEIKEKYGDDRKTMVISHGVKQISDEDLIPDDESVLVMTQGGYVKRTDPSEYRIQKRGGVGVVDLNTKEEDFITRILTTKTHSNLLFFTDRGKVYQIKMYEIPQGKRTTKGKSLMNFLALSGDEKINSVVAMPRDVRNTSSSLFMVTERGVVKRVMAKNFFDVRSSGIIAIKLSPGDRLINSLFVEASDDIILITKKGRSIRFSAQDVRDMGRSAAGVRGMNLASGDTIIGADVIKKSVGDSTLLVVSEQGYGKQTSLSEYKVQKRGGSGILTAKLTSKTGALVSGEVITAEYAEIVAMSKKGQVIRLSIKDIPSLGRQTQGVRVMRLRAHDHIACVVCI